MAIVALTGLGGLPHARGGVSHSHLAKIALSESSPRPWGCFLQIAEFFDHVLVFPTPVGVFPGLAGAILLLNGLPHARGGVSV